MALVRSMLGQSSFAAISVVLCNIFQPAIACPDWRLDGQRLNHSSDDLWTPHSHRVIAGGREDLEQCSAPGVGYVAAAPDFVLKFSNNARRRDLELRVEASCDTVLLVNDSAANWHFNDDDDGFNPRIRLSAAREGLYDIWIGTYGTETCSAQLILETFGGTRTPPVASVQITRSSGTGFFVNNDGWILTNNHVIEGCDEVEIVGHGRVSGIVRDINEDLAALRLQHPTNIEPLIFRSRPARLAEPVHAIGFPLSDVLSQSVRVTSGTVNSLTGLGVRQNLIQISAPIQPGNSGGPVIDGFGLVVGVTTATLSEVAYDRAQNVNFALPSAEALRFLEQNAIAYIAFDHASASDANDFPDQVEIAAAATTLVQCNVSQ
jgi:S1-C subfamily serine protease